MFEIILIREGLCSGPEEQCSEVLPGLPCLKQEVLKGLTALTIHSSLPWAPQHLLALISEMR